MRARRAAAGVRTPRLLPVLLLLAALAAPARADDEMESARWAAGDVAAVEKRLDRAGIAAADRLRILAALQRGADWLVRQQLPDGTFRRPDASTPQLGTDAGAVEALAAWALEAAGGRAHREAAGRTLGWMAPGGERFHRAIRGRVRAAAFAALFLRERGGDPGLLQSLAESILAARDGKSGLWTAAPAADVGFGTIGNTVGGKGEPDLETSRDALLGLRACAAAGVAIPSGVWKHALDGLLDRPSYQDLTGVLTLHGFGDRVVSGQRLAALALARTGLEDRAPLDDGRREALDGFLSVARVAFANEALDAAWWRSRGLPSWTGGTAWAHDAATAALLEGVDRMEGDAWFPAVERALEATQGGDGSWGAGAGAGAAAIPGGSALVDTAFAVLVLARAVEPLREGPGPAPPPPAPPVWPDPAAAPPRETVPWADAADALAWLEDLLRDPAADPDRTLRALLFVGRARGRIAPGPAPKEVADWDRRAEEAFLRAAALVRPLPDRRNAAAAVNLAAARLLAFARPAAAAILRRILEEEVLPVRDVDPDRDFLRAVFATLLRLDAAGSLPWMAETALSTSDEAPERIVAQEALRAMATAGRAPGAARRAAVERVCAVYEGVEAGASGTSTGRASPGSVPSSPRAWFAFRRFALDALRALCTDPVSGKEARSKDGRVLVAVLPYREFLRLHQDLSLPPWAAR